MKDVKVVSNEKGENNKVKSLQNDKNTNPVAANTDKGHNILAGI